MKKIYTTISLIIICASYLLIFEGLNSYNNTINSSTINARIFPSQSQSKNFINCIFNDNYDRWNHQAWVLNFLDRYKDSLHFNSIHYYGSYESSYYGVFHDSMNADQKTHNTQLLISIGNKDLKTLTSRPNVELYCYGQRLVYEVSQNGSTTINNGFCYQNVMPNTYTTDSGRTVLHAKPGDNSPGYLCKDIYENLQHTDLYDFVQLEDSTWHIKPMMRIPANIFNDSNTTRVFAVSVYNYQGVRIDTIVVRVNNFRENGLYGGQYTDKFTFLGLNADSLKTSGSRTTGLGKGRDSAGDYTTWKNNCKVDFRVYWFGQVEVWFDKMTVDDDRANDLFTPSDTSFHADVLIKQEANLLGSDSANLAFFADEVTYSNIPCVKYVDSVLKSTNPAAKLHTAVTNYFQVRGLKNDTLGHRAYFQNVHLNSFNADAHEINGGGVKIPNNFTSYDSRIPSNWKAASYTEYTNNVQGRVFGDKNSITPEEDTVGENYPNHWGSLIYQIELARNQRDLYSPNSQFIMQPQIQAVVSKKNSDTYFTGGLREPTNEEIQAEAMVSVAHGAEGICWFLYASVKYPKGTYGIELMPYENYYVEGPENSPSSDTLFEYIYGLTELLQVQPTLPPRYNNMYGEDKWNYIKKMNIKIEHWKPVLDKIKFANGYSIHSEGAHYNFISDLKSIKRNVTLGYTDDPPCTDCDPTNQRYWEMGFYNPDFSNSNVDQNDKSKYFMMVNRRCFPDIHNDGDLRQLKIKFDSTNLSGFRNWKIIELDSNRIIRTFDKDSNNYVDMGVYQPGEGKLYKIAPVMQEGGTLVANEAINGVSFTCKDTVISNGKNITFKGHSNTVSFSDSGTIIMNNANFYVGDTLAGSSSQDKNGFKALTGHNWNGLRFNNCNVRLYQSKFENIASPVVNFAVKIYNCRLADIRNNQFILNSDTAGGINSYYLSGNDPDSFNLYINYNTFTMNNSRTNAIQVQGFSGITLPAYIQHNIMTSNGYATGIMMSSITGAAITNDSIVGFSNGLNIMGTSADLFKNSITNTSASSTGVLASSSSILNLNISGEYITAGENILTNTASSSCYNINVQGAYFYLYDGANKFDVHSNSHSPNKHLYGYFPSGTGSAYQQGNCFKIDGTAISSPTLPNNTVYSGSGGSTPITFTFIPYNCSAHESDGQAIVDIGYSMYDTIPTFSGGGEGSGMSNLQFENKKEKIEKAAEITSSNKDLYDSISIAMRFKNYFSVKSLCYELIGTYPDSTESISSLSKLYLSLLMTDTSSASCGNLKTYFENLILNHPGNEAMVWNCNYLVQKCKVRLKQYESAMNGFQNIINENPYSYEGLLARWDYAATSLLLQGSGGGESNVQLSFNTDQLPISHDINSTLKTPDNDLPFSNTDELNDDPNDKYDKKVFSKEQRMEIRKTIINVTQNKKQKAELKISSLEQAAEIGDETAKNELSVMKTLKEINKPYKPENISDHMKIVNNDIQKIFGNKESYANENQNLIPTEYYLAQNYPNPFNPVTKIKFDLPEDGKVKLVIYDILGREIIKLVNNELKTAGKYSVEFNGANLASGVYFYRLEANKFVQTKRMVLIK